jgi:hypothetical protein
MMSQKSDGTGIAKPLSARYCGAMGEIFTLCLPLLLEDFIMTDLKNNRMAQLTGLLWAVAAVITAVSQFVHHS